MLTLPTLLMTTLERMLSRQTSLYSLPDEAATLKLGAALAEACAAVGASGRFFALTTSIVYLHGDLGAGKTTLARGFLRRLGYSGAVKSPTYTLVEPYESGASRVYHFDLYRLADPQEFEFLGVEDYFQEGCVSLIEWPEQGGSVIPPPDLSISLEQSGSGRQARVDAGSERGESLIQKIAV
jgi:tRNA threonylcarbamoyladenosine biosynthesis protein TsaE